MKLISSCHLNSYAKCQMPSVYTYMYYDLFIKMYFFYIKTGICKFYKVWIYIRQYDWDARLVKSPSRVNRNKKNTSNNTNGFKLDPNNTGLQILGSMHYGYMSVLWHHFFYYWSTWQPKVDPLTGVIQHVYTWQFVVDIYFNRPNHSSNYCYRF